MKMKYRCVLSMCLFVYVLVYWADCVTHLQRINLTTHTHTFDCCCFMWLFASVALSCYIRFDWWSHRLFAFSISVSCEYILWYVCVYSLIVACHCCVVHIVDGYVCLVLINISVRIVWWCFVLHCVVYLIIYLHIQVSIICYHCSIHHCSTYCTYCCFSYANSLITWFDNVELYSIVLYRHHNVKRIYCSLLTVYTIESNSWRDNHKGI